jgi:hypothetical protein
MHVSNCHRFTGRLPFESRSESELFQLIQEANISKCFKENSVWKSVSDKGRNINIYMTQVVLFCVDICVDFHLCIIVV